MRYALRALPRLPALNLFQGRLLWAALALGGLLLAGCATTKKTGDIFLDEDYPEIERQYRDAVREQPANGHLHETLGYALWKQGKYEEAENEYRASIRLMQDSMFKATAYGRLAVVIADQGRFIEAEQTALQGVHLGPDNEWAHYYLACCYALWDKKEDAIKCLQKADEKGFSYWPSLKKDKELREIRADSRVRAIDAHVRARWKMFSKPYIMF